MKSIEKEIPLISVIVPVYNCEPYFDHCVESIVNQTYTNLEIILVDDGSSDNCPQMCDAWAQRDNRIKVIHRVHGGSSDARNDGISVASGELFGFVDGDDYISPEMYEFLFDKLTEIDSDISVCGIEMVWNDGRSRVLTRSGNAVLDNREAMEAIVKESWLKQPVVNRLYKRSVVDGMLFETGKIHEDLSWSYLPISVAEKICVFDTPLYFYVQHSDSIMGAKVSEKRIDALEGKLKRLEFLKKNYPDLTEPAQKDLHFFAMYLMQNAQRNLTGEELKQFKQKLKPYTCCAPALKSLTLTEKAWVLLSKLSFTGTCRLRNLLKVGI